MWSGLKKTDSEFILHDTEGERGKRERKGRNVGKIGGRGRKREGERWSQREMEREREEMMAREGDRGQQNVRRRGRVREGEWERERV